MKARFRLMALILLLALAGAAALPIARAQASTYQYFDQTGHNVQGEFWRFYQRAADPTTVYGYPITEQFVSRDGLLVQYFQRARFEWHPELPEGQRVQLGPLGRQTYTPGEALAFDAATGCRQFASGYPVCFIFLDFFDRYGGEAQFGQPISAFERRDDIVVQTFERARFEYRPSRPEGQRVVLADLGSQAFDLSGEDQGLTGAVDPLDNSIEPQVLELQARAFVWKAVALPRDNQVLFVIVQDQNLRPVANTAVNASVHWPDGTLSAYAAVSNQNGIATLAFDYGVVPHGSLVPLTVKVDWNGLRDSTTTSFRIWR